MFEQELWVVYDVEGILDVLNKVREEDEEDDALDSEYGLSPSTLYPHWQNGRNHEEVTAQGIYDPGEEPLHPPAQSDPEAAALACGFGKAFTSEFEAMNYVLDIEELWSSVIERICLPLSHKRGTADRLLSVADFLQSAGCIRKPLLRIMRVKLSGGAVVFTRGELAKRDASKGPSMSDAFQQESE